MTDLYTPGEIARAVGVPEETVLEYMSGGRVEATTARAGTPPLSASSYVTHADAVRIGVALLTRLRLTPTAAPDTLFAIFAPVTSTSLASPRAFAVSSTVHGTLLAIVVVLGTFVLAPRAAVLTRGDASTDTMRLIFLATPGPGGGGGGGGLRQPAPPARAMREGHKPISSPAPEVKPAEPPPAPPDRLPSEQLPTLVAPIVSSPADPRTRDGVLEQTVSDTDAHGPGSGGGAGTGTGSGLGPGSGPGLGAGSGGGTGGGPYRPGSGIDPPRLLHEVKADYTEDARRRGLSGEVVLEIVVVRDGSVGDVKVLQGLGGGLNDRAVQAVRQWRFAPAQRQGVPVDVLVEVAVEFKLR